VGVKRLHLLDSALQLADAALDLVERELLRLDRRGGVRPWSCHAHLLLSPRSNARWYQVVRAADREPSAHADLESLNFALASRPVGDPSEARGGLAVTS